MGMKISFNRAALEAKITQHGEKAVKGMSEVMRKRARLIRDLARSNAPVRTGLLQDNIDYVTIKGSDRRNSYVVYVDKDAQHGRRFGNLGSYAGTMERKLAPYGRGDYSLGDGSRAKRASGHDVGGRYFKRAVDEGTRLLNEELRAAAKGKTFTGVSAATVKAQFRPKTQMASNRKRKTKNRKKNK